jgi:hypothetical protein
VEVEAIADPGLDAGEEGILSPINYPVIGWRNIPVFLWWFEHRWEFRGMSSFRRFHSIAALYGDGLRPELQALFERLAVDPHTELFFARVDGMVQSGPDPIGAEGSLRRGEARPSNAALFFAFWSTGHCDTT